ncbi:MAG: hypothetical protein DRI86_04015 [Bacteroidetes bacterium]|nr:MAG: hypothetical protein DRI86_04015 [Bacteroidota bacterium]
MGEYKTNIEECHRYASFDYCYGYFKSTSDLTKDIEKSCLVLGFYLASWGMYRGSSFILQKSVKYLQRTIVYISKLDKSYWEIDVDYSDDNIKKIKEIYDGIKDILIKNKEADLTLITKILLGVFGFVPAYDNYFCDTFRNRYKGQSGFRRVNEKSLKLISHFYTENKDIIDKYAKEIYVLSFDENKQTRINYPKAKIIDMYGFQKGLNEKKKERK